MGRPKRPNWSSPSQVLIGAEIQVLQRSILRERFSQSRDPRGEDAVALKFLKGPNHVTGRFKIQKTNNLFRAEDVQTVHTLAIHYSI